MEHFINDSESNKGMSHKSDGVNTRESTHLSKLPWLAHWKPSSTENASEDISKLPTPSVRSKQTSDENLLQEPHYSKSGTPESDRPASKDSEQDRQKDEEEFVEVRPSLLLPGECIVARSIKNKRMEKLCDLSRGPQITTLPSQSKLVLANHSPAFKQPCNSDDQRKISTHGVQSPLLFPSSNANFVSLDTQPPTLYKVLKGCQKTTGLGAASGACSPPHATDTSFGTIAVCKAKTWPLAVRECSGQESNVSKACNGRLEDLADQSHQVLKVKHESENYNLYDSKLDRYKFIESASVGPKHGKPEFKSNTSNLRPFICSKDGNSQCNFRETHNDHMLCTHSALCKNKQCDCENKQCQHGCCFTFLDSEKRISMTATANGGNSGTERNFTSPVVGDFLFSRGEGKLKLNFSDMEFSGRKTGPPKDAKIAEIPDTNVSNTVPACSLHDLKTVRICTTVDKAEGVPGGPSKFSKTTHHFVITKKTDMAFSKEDQLIERSSVEAKIDRNSFLQFFGLSPPFCPCDNKDTWMKLTSCRAARAGLLNEDTRHCYRSSDIAEETSTFQQARASPLKSMDNNEIHTETGGFEASFGQTPPELVSKDNVTWKKNADSVEEMVCLVHCTAQASSLNVKHESSSEMEPLDLNTFMSRDSGKGLALTAVNKDYVEAGISCDPLERITSARTKRSRNDVSPSCSAMDGCEDRKEMCASRVQSLDAEDLPADADQPDPSQSDFSHPDQHTSSRWVKRLKHSHLEAFGTKRSVDGDISSHDKKIKLFSKVLNYGRSISNSELLSNACIEKQQQQLVEMVILPRQRISAVDLMRENKDILSDPWIQRWRSAKGGGIQISSAEVICEPECSKVSIIEMQGKEFPSLGAMALMGKTLTNFRPCEFRRMGPFVLWKTKGH